MLRPRPSSSAAGALALALLVAALPLARGGVGPWPEAAAAVLALAALAAATRRATGIPRPGALLLLVLAACALQLVPVPAWVHGLSPGAVRTFEVSLAPLGSYPAARPLSLDPAASARALAKAIACTAAFLAAASYGTRPRRRERVLAGLGAAGVAAAAAVLSLALAGAAPLVAPRFPFVNPNHLAGLLVLSGFVMLGLALRRSGDARALWLLAFAATGGVAVLTLSRGGLAAFGVGAALFVGLHVRARRAERRDPSPGAHAALAGALVAALGIAAYVGLDPVLSEVRTLRAGSDDAKVRLWRPALDVIRDFPLAGVGRGAFPAAFAAYQTESSDVTFTHVENEWLQPLVDLGIPAGLLLVGTFAAVWIAAARRRDLSSTDVGLLAGTGALAAQNTVDFSLELLGVALPFAVAMGLLARDAPAVPIRRRALRAGIAAAVAAAAVALVVARARGGDADAERVARAAGGTATAEAARAAIRWHPADWLLHATAGVRLGAEGRCAEAMPWLLRAMSLDPLAPAPHLAAARCLVGRDDAAAKREFRLAVAFGAPALPEAASVYPALRDLFEVAPATPDGLLALGHLLAARHPGDAAVAFGRVVDEFLDPRGLLPLARVRAALGDPDAALALARRHAAGRPADPEGWLVAAAALAALGREDDARAEAERGLAAIPGSGALLGFLAERAMARGRWSEARRLADEVAPRSASEIAAKHLLAARALAGQGRDAEALERARSAAAAAPEVGATWLAVADHATRAGRHDEAIDALRRAAALPGAPADGHARRIAALEAAKADALARTLERRALHGTGAAADP